MPAKPLPFWERHPILKQVYDDASELSKQQIILPSVMTVATFIAALLLGESISPWLVLRSAGLSIIVGVSLYLLIAILRAPFVIIGQHHREIIDLRQQGAKPESEPIWKPLIERDASRIIRRPLDEANTIYEHEVPDNELNEETNVYVALSRFHHRVGELGQAAYVEIKAHVYLGDADSNAITDYDAVWWPRHQEPGYCDRRYRLSVGDRKEIVLALIDPKNTLWTYEYHTRRNRDKYVPGEELSPVTNPVSGVDFMIAVEIILEFDSVVIDEKRFQYRLQLHDKPHLEEI
jgi:hypothetical protein